VLTFGIRLGSPESILLCRDAYDRCMDHPHASVRKLLDAMALMEERLTAALAGSTSSYLASTSEAVDKFRSDLDPCCASQDSIQHHRVEDPSGEEDLQPHAEMVDSFESDPVPLPVVYDRYDEPNHNEILEVLALLEYNEEARITDAIEGLIHEASSSMTAALEPVEHRRRQVLTATGEVEQKPTEGITNEVEAEEACELPGDATDFSDPEDTPTSPPSRPSLTRSSTATSSTTHRSPGRKSSFHARCTSHPTTTARLLHSLQSPNQAEVVKSSEAESARPPVVCNSHVELGLYSFTPSIFSVEQVIEEEVPVDMPTRCSRMDLNRGAYSVLDLLVICIVGGPNSNEYGTNRVLHHTIGLPDFSQELQGFQAITYYQAIINNLDDAQEQMDMAIATTLRKSKRADPDFSSCQDKELLDHLAGVLATESVGVKGDQRIVPLNVTLKGKSVSVRANLNASLDGHQNITEDIHAIQYFFSKGAKVQRADDVIEPEVEKLMVTLPNRCLTNCFNLVDSCFIWDGVPHRQPWPPPTQFMILGDGVPDRFTPWKPLDADVYNSPEYKEPWPPPAQFVILGAGVGLKVFDISGWDLLAEMRSHSSPADHFVSLKKGLCACCAEKWLSGRKCAATAQQPQLHAMEEVWNLFAEEFVTAPDAESIEAPDDQLFKNLSHSAWLGSEIHQTLKLHGSIQQQPLLISKLVLCALEFLARWIAHGIGAGAGLVTDGPSAVNSGNFAIRIWDPGGHVKNNLGTSCISSGGECEQCCPEDHRRARRQGRDAGDQKGTR
jgi:hypothetical protein